MKHTTEAIRKIDWALLRMQKAWLLGWEDDIDFGGAHVAPGLINLIDALQDAAVADGVATEEEVFGTHTKDRLTPP